MSIPDGQQAVELIRELKRSDWLPPYNEDGFNRVLQETKVMSESICEILLNVEPSQASEEVRSALAIQHRKVLHDKRCLLGYTNYRLDKISKLRWQTGQVLTEDIKCLLNPAEIKYFNDYNLNVNDYSRIIGFDLTADKHPPKHLYIEVLVKEDCGEIMTERGTVVLEKNTTHFLRRSDVEHLIRQGYLEQKDTEDMFL
ncbi:hypothetical protein WA158_007565 [Blastocystis sp. Blastoise]